MGRTLGGTAADLSAPCSSTPARPPTDGWRYYDRNKQEYVSDPSLRCLPPSGPSCTRLEVSLEGRAGQLVGRCEGSYRELAKVYSVGHKVRRLTAAGLDLYLLGSWALALALAGLL